MEQILYKTIDEALIHYHQGQVHKAQEQLQEISSHHLDSMEEHLVLCNALQSIEAYGQAHHLLACAIQTYPNEPQLFYALGGSFIYHGNLKMAQTCYYKAIDLQPDYAASYIALGKLLLQQQDIEQAQQKLLQAINLDHTNPEALTQLGLTHCMQQEYEKGKEYFLAAISYDPCYITALSGLVEIYELLHDANHVTYYANQVLSLVPQSIYAHTALAQIEIDNKQYSDAIARLTALESIQNPPSQDVLRKYHFTLAMAFDKKKQCDDAFSHFAKGNTISRQMFQSLYQKKEHFLLRIKQMRNESTTYSIKQWSKLPLPTSNHKLFFLVGFPRSGTTLLNKMLDSHPTIQTLEEAPFISELDYDLRHKTSIETLNSSDQLLFRERYFNRVKQSITYNPGHILVDKMPLNFLYAPVITRIFPEAKFIFLSRHPLDACLSCFMQNFAMNTSNIHFTTLEDTITFYCQTIQNWMHYVDHLLLPHYTIAYENITKNYTAELEKLLHYLGIAWDDSIENYTTHQHTHRIIGTPSFHQVTQPIYTNATNRWQYYRDYLSPFQETLAPFLEYFGYNG